MTEDPIFLPIPVEIIVRHIDTITREGASLLVTGRVSDAEAATALALYDALAGEPQLQMVKEYLAGNLDHQYPGPSGREFWLNIVTTVAKLASDMMALSHSPASSAPSAPKPAPSPRPGQMIGNPGPMVAVAHPLHTAGRPPIQRFDHPNAVLYAGDARTAVHEVKEAAKRAGLFSIGDANGISIGVNRRASLAPTTRVMVRFTKINFNDQSRTSGTAILLHGVDTGVLEKLKAALLR